MASIIYKPQCDKCGTIINDEITYKEVWLEYGDHTNIPFLHREHTIIQPRVCERCGELFDRIEIELPREE